MEPSPLTGESAVTGPGVEVRGARFGAAGQLVLSGAYGASIGRSSYKSGASYAGYSISPGIDWFVLNNLSLGVDGSFGHRDEQGFASDDSTVRLVGDAWSVGGRIAYNVPFGRWLSFYPRLTIGYEESTYDERFVAFQNAPLATAPAWSPLHTHHHAVTTQLFAPLLLHVRTHLFVGFGPNLVHGFGETTASAPGAATGPSTRLGAGLVVGGYFGGPTEPLPEDVRPEIVGYPPARFGETGTWVVSAESALGGSYTFDDRTSYWSGGFTVSPGVDYFFTDLVSAGATLIVGDARARGYDAPTGKAYESVSTTVGGGARIGINGRLASWLSVYPRAGVDLVYADAGSAVSGKGSEHGTTRATASLFVPFLFHLSQHLFVGVGPRAAADFVSKRDDDAENPATFVGASAIVGGWFKTNDLVGLTQNAKEARR